MSTREPYLRRWCTPLSAGGLGWPTLREARKANPGATITFLKADFGLGMVGWLAIERDFTTQSPRTGLVIRRDGRRMPVVWNNPDGGLLLIGQRGGSCEGAHAERWRGIMKALVDAELEIERNRG